MKDVLDILQTEEAATRTIQNLNSTNTTTANVHYARYDKRKKYSGKNSHSNSTTDKGDKKCFRCGYAFEKEHLKSCPAKDAECRFCGLTGHFVKCCGKAGKFPKGGNNTNSTTSTNSTSNSGVTTASAHTLTAHSAPVQHPVQPVQEEYYYDEDGYIHKSEISYHRFKSLNYSLKFLKGRMLRYQLWIIVSSHLRNDNSNVFSMRHDIS